MKWETGFLPTSTASLLWSQKRPIPRGLIYQSQTYKGEPDAGQSGRAEEMNSTIPWAVLGAYLSVREGVDPRSKSRLLSDDALSWKKKFNLKQQIPLEKMQMICLKIIIRSFIHWIIPGCRENSWNSSTGTKLFRPLNKISKSYDSTDSMLDATYSLTTSSQTTSQGIVLVTHTPSYWGGYQQSRFPRVGGFQVEEKRKESPLRTARVSSSAYDSSGEGRARILDYKLYLTSDTFLQWKFKSKL